MPQRVEKRLAGLERCDRLMMVEAGTDVIRLARELDARRTAFAALTPAPPRHAAWGEGRAAIRAVLDPRRLPGDAVVMVGTAPEERVWSDAAQLASFLAADSYFANP